LLFFQLLNINSPARFQPLLFSEPGFRLPHPNVKKLLALFFLLFSRQQIKVSLKFG
jgi:hypothetical protein